jgi:putative salt-induced outer membrane protein
VQVHHNQAIARGLADWSFRLTDTASLVDNVLVESGSDNTFARNLFGIQVAVSKGLAMKAGLETRYNSRVDAGIRNTDNLTTVNLVYDFK